MVGANDALCLDRGLVGFGPGHCFRHAKIEVLKDGALCKSTNPPLYIYIEASHCIKRNSM